LFRVADPRVAAALESAVAGLPGVVRVDSGLSDMGALAQCYRITQGAEIHAQHGAWIARAAPRFGPAIAERFADAARIGAAELRAAVAARAVFAGKLRETLGDDGVLLLPAAPTQPLTPNAGPAALGNFYRRALGLGAIAGFAGAPQLVVPAGSIDACPIGLGAIGPMHADHTLLGLASTLTRHLKPPAP
jgi:amidase